MIYKLYLTFVLQYLPPYVNIEPFNQLYLKVDSYEECLEISNMFNNVIEIDKFSRKEDNVKTYTICEYE